MAFEITETASAGRMSPWRRPLAALLLLVAIGTAGCAWLGITRPTVCRFEVVADGKPNDDIPVKIHVFALTAKQVAEFRLESWEVLVKRTKIYPEEKYFYLAEGGHSVDIALTSETDHIGFFARFGERKDGQNWRLVKSFAELEGNKVWVKDVDIRIRPEADK